MTVRFNSKLETIPGYTPGVPKGHSAEDVAGSALAQLASNESPYAPLPEVVDAISGAAGSMNRYPDPEATLLRKRLGERHGVDHERIAPANGSAHASVRLSVSDNGPGFAPEVLPRVFEPYVTTKTTGTGLGLAIVKKIVEEHGARVDISNGADGGARISVLFTRLAESVRRLDEGRQAQDNERNQTV